MHIKRIASAILTVILMGSLVGTAQADTAYFQQVADKLQSNPVYVDSKASPSVTSAEATQLSNQIEKTDYPIFLVLIDNSQLTSTSIDEALAQIAIELGGRAMIGLSSDKGFYANGFGIATSVASQAGPLAKQSVDVSRQKNGKPVPFEVYTYWVSSTGNLAAPTAQAAPVRTDSQTLAQEKESSDTWWIVLLIILGILVMVGLTAFLISRRKQRRREQREARLATDRLEREINQLNVDLVAIDKDLRPEAYGAHTSALTNAQSAKNSFDAGDLEGARSFLHEAQRFYRRIEKLNEALKLSTPINVPDDRDDTTDEENGMSSKKQGVRVRRPGGGREIVVKQTSVSRTRSSGNSHYYHGGTIGGVQFQPGYYADPFWNYVFLAAVLDDHSGSNPNSQENTETQGAGWSGSSDSSSGSGWGSSPETASTQSSGSSWSSDSSGSSDSGGSSGGGWSSGGSDSSSGSSFSSDSGGSSFG